ncbi:MAG: hypothetical protein SWX82_13940 [Cyanobacteriota bacterium]|nr:hypothetical protein [Cyanobacteriota bacterium]
MVLQLSAKITATKKLIAKLEKTLKSAKKKGFPHTQARNKFFHQYLPTPKITFEILTHKLSKK